MAIINIDLNFDIFMVIIQARYWVELRRLANSKQNANTCLEVDTDEWCIFMLVLNLQTKRSYFAHLKGQQIRVTLASEFF